MSGEQATASVVVALEELGIQYMLVGSFSTNFYGIARSTRDADIVIQLNEATLTSTHGTRACLDAIVNLIPADLLLPGTYPTAEPK